MRLIMKVTGIVESSDTRLSVELHGKHGKAQLNLPMGQRAGLTVGSEFTLTLNGPGFAGAIDESVASLEPFGAVVPAVTL
jgi:hypothetical protein